MVIPQYGDKQGRDCMKVLHISKSSDGAYWAVRQVTELVRRGVDVHVALPNATGEAVPAWRTTGATLHFLDCALPVQQPQRIPGRRQSIRHLVRELKPDLIHNHHVTTAMMTRLALWDSPVPKIFQVPGPLHLEHWYTRKAELSLADTNDYWIGTSRYICNLYRRAGVKRDRLFLSYHTVDKNIFSAQRTGYLRHKLNIPQDAFVVGNINFIYPPKRYLGHRVGLKCHEDVIEAIAIAQQKCENIWGVLIGSTFGKNPSYEFQLRKLAKSKGRGKILMPGKFESWEVGQSWPAFDCAVHVPLSENCGGVVEPLMSGVPTIAATVGGLPEVVKPGVTGMLVPPRHPDLLAESILDVRRNHASAVETARRGRELIATMFDPGRCAKEVFDIYQHILTGAPRPAEFSVDKFLDQRQSAYAVSAS